MKSRIYKKLLSSALSLALLCNIGVTPVLAITTNDDTTTITSFVALDEDVQKQSVPVGTQLEDLNLPNTLTVKGHTTDTEEETDITIEDVGWELNLESTVNQGITKYDPTMGGYAFTPVLPEDYTLKNDVELPEIWVVIETRHLQAIEESKAFKLVVGDTTTYYDDLSAAITAANSADECTLTLQTDSTYDGRDLHVTSKNMTLDLNGKTLTMTIGQISLNDASVNLTVKDSAGDGILKNTNTFSGETPATIGVMNGNLTVENGCIESTGNASRAVQVFEGTVRIKGGNLKGVYCSLDVSSMATVIITGGTFYSKEAGYSILASNLTTLLAPGYVYYKGDAATGTVVKIGEYDIFLSETVTVGPCIHVWSKWSENDSGVATRNCLNNCKEIQTAAAKVNSNDTATYYTNLNEALDNALATDGATLTLLANSEYSSSIYIDKTMILDLNGKTLKPDYQLILNSENANLTVKDSKTNGKLTSKDICIGVSNGKLTIENGIFEANDFPINITGGSTFIEGGTFKGESCLTVKMGGTVTISNGYFEGSSYGIQVMGGTANISGGSFKGNTHGLFHQNGAVTLTGGTFYGQNNYGSIFSTQNYVNDFLGEGYGYKNEGDQWVGYNTSSINDTVTVSQAPIKITTQPIDATVSYGYTDTHKLSVIADKQGGVTGEITYQWYKSDGTEVGENSNEFTFPAGQDAGEYQYYCELSLDGFKVKTKTVTVTVEKASALIENKKEDGYLTSYTYTSKSITAPMTDQFSTNTDGTMSFSWATKQVPNIPLLGEPSDVGDYILTVTTAEGTNWKPGSKSFDVTIAYLETDKVAFLDGTQGDDGWYKSDVTVNAPNNFKISTQNGKDADWTANLTISDDGTKNYTYYLKDDSTDYITDEKNIEIKKDNTVPTKPTLGDSEIKDTTAIIKVSAEDATSGIKEYTLTEANDPDLTQTSEDGVFDLTGLSPNTTYHFSVTVKDNAGNVSEVSDNIEITTEKTSIELAEVELTNDTGLTYTGLAHEPTVIVKLNGNTLDALQYTISYSDNISAGTCTVTITASENGDYSGTVKQDVSFTIDPATPTLTFVQTTVTITYSGSEARITPPTVELVNNDAYKGTITYTYTEKGKASNLFGLLADEKKGLPTNAGSYIITAHISEFKNYKATDSTNKLELTINKSTPTLVIDTMVGKTYDGSAILAPTKDNMTITGAGYEDVTFLYSTMETMTEPTKTAPSNAGTYWVQATVGETDNTNAEKSMAVSFTITPKTVDTPTIELEEAEFVYDGTVKEPKVLSVKDGESVIPNEEYTVSYSDNIEAGTQAKIIIKNKTDGNYIIDKTQTFEIRKKVQEPLVMESITTKEYGDGTFTLSTTGGTGTGDVTYEIQNDKGVISINGDQVTIQKAGEAIVIAKKDGGNNYETATSEPVTITIDKTSQEKLAITNKDYALSYTYTANAIPTPSKDNFTTESEGTMSFEWFKDATTLGTTPPKAAGSYTLVVTTEETENREKRSETFEVVISFLNTEEKIGLSETPKEDEWYKGNVIVTAPSDFKISTGNDDSAVWSDTLTISEDRIGEYAYYLKNKNGHITDKKTIEINKDTTPPTKPTLEDSEITDTTAIINVSAEDATSGIKAYILTNKITKDSPFTSADGKFELTDLSPNTTYNYTVTVIDNAGNVSEVSDNIEIKTNKASIELAEVELTNDTGLTYTGLAQEPTVIVKLNGNTLDAKQYTISYSDNISAGTCTVTITASENGDYSGTVKQEVQFTIDPATPTLTFVQTTETITFSGSEAQITPPTVKLVNNEPYKGAITYTYTEKGKASTLFGLLADEKEGLPTNAGTYFITAHIAGFKNYKAADSDTLELTIKKFTPTLVIDTMVGKTYDGSAILAPTKDDMTIKGAVYKDVTFLYSTMETMTDSTKTAPTNAGTYWVQATVEETDNTNAAKSMAVSFTITPKTVATPTIELEEAEFVYDGTEIKPTVASVKDGGTLISKDEYTVSYSNNIEAGTALVTITDNVGGNYTVSGTKNFEIKKGTQATLTINEIGKKTYGDGTFTLSTTGGTGTEDVTYEIQKDTGVISISGDQVTIQKAGKATVIAKKDGGLNYETATSEPVTITIQKADQDELIIDDVIGKKYGESAFTLKTTGGTTLKEVTYSILEGDGVLSIDGAKASIIGAGKVVVRAVMAGNENYNEVTTTKEIEIGKADAPNIDYPNASSLTYGKTLSDSSLSGGSVVYGSFAWDDESIVPTVNNQGYLVKFTPSKDTIQNYEAITTLTKEVQITIEKATPSLSIQAKVSGEVGARQAELIATLDKVGKGSLPTGTVTFVDRVTGEIMGASNVNVEQGIATYTWTGLQDQIYHVKAVYHGEDNYNSITSDEISFDTRKENQETLLIEDFGEKTYGDETFTLRTTGGSGEGSVSFMSSDPSVMSIEGTVASIHKAGDVIITARKNADNDYNEAEVSTSITIKKKTITFTTEDLTIVKGQELPTMSYHMEGLVNGDTLISEPVVSTTIKDTNTVGTYSITISGGEVSNSENYNIVYVDGSLVIKQGYTVSFDTTGGEEVTEVSDVSHGATIAKPSDPSRSGYRFDGWYRDHNFLTPWDFMKDTITSDTTLYAKWTKKGAGDIETGDHTNPMLWVVLLGICFSGMIVLKRSKKQNKR